MIEDTLRQHEILKIRFAHDFNLSRPTLDEYIRKYEGGNALPKEKYQIIFDSLFKMPLSHTEFINRYKNLANIYKRDVVMKLTDLDPNTTDLITNIVDQLRMSVDAKSGHSPLIPFIEYVASNYRSQKVANAWICYFNELNGLNDESVVLSNEEKWFYFN